VSGFVPALLAARGFLARAKGVELAGDASAWVLRGTSDRRWTYAGGDAAGLLRSSDTHFAAVPPSLANELARARHVRWRRDARTFVLPAHVELPAGAHPVIPLTARDAETVNEHWEHRDDVSLAYIRACVERDPALGVHADGTVVGWELVHDDGAMGWARLSCSRPSGGRA